MKAKSTLSLLKNAPAETILRHAKAHFSWEAPSADHVLLGLGCMADHVSTVRAILKRRPELINEPFVTLGLSREAKTALNAHPPIFDLVPPLLAATTVESWAVAAFLVDQPGIELDWMSPPVEGGWSALTRTLRIGMDAKNRSGTHPALRLAARLVEAGADIAKEDANGTSAFSMVFYDLIESGLTSKPTSFRSIVAAMEVFLPHLSTLPPERFAKGSLGRAELENAMVDLETSADMEYFWGPSMDWFKTHTGITIPGYHECLLGWLFSNGLQLDVIRDFAALHAPQSLALGERRGLEEVLPAAASGVSATSLTSRLRL
jgi:hypothetical protein